MINNFHIFQNKIPITNIPFNTKNYYNTKNFPNSTPTYNIITLLNKKNIIYQSHPTTIQTQFPSLLPPNNLQTITNTTINSTILSFNYNTTNINQFKITHNTINKPTKNINTIFYNYNNQIQTFKKINKTPKPKITYTYNTITIKKINKNSFKSKPTIIQIIYPHPPNPQSLNKTTNNPT